MTHSPKTLAVVRCGDNSLHTSWASVDRAFDVGISYFGNDADKAFPEADFVHRYKGGKWDGLYNFFETFPQVLEQYDYFWLPDDDIAGQADALNRLIAIAGEHKLAICQPSLDDQSYFSHTVTLHHSSFQLRYTNFVEIMVPLISAGLLKQTLHRLAGNRSGFGLDFLWPQLAAEQSGGPYTAAVVDSVSVRHTRPCGADLHALIKRSGGPSVLDELQTTLADVSEKRGATIRGISVPRVTMLSGLDLAGRRRSGVRLALAAAQDLLFRHPNQVQGVTPASAARHALKVLVG